jgi:hypothetical protein
VTVMKKPLLKALSYSKCDKLDQGLLVIFYPLS